VASGVGVAVTVGEVVGVGDGDDVEVGDEVAVGVEVKIATITVRKGAGDEVAALANGAGKGVAAGAAEWQAHSPAASHRINIHFALAIGG
jgi:hypothetical protein